jgi:lactate racemase
MGTQGNVIPVAQIAYGKSRIPLAMDPAKAEWSVIAPVGEAALPDPHTAFRAAAAKPVGAPTLRGFAGPDEKVVIVTADGTRPVPNRQLVPWVIEELGIPEKNVTVLLGTGTHRPNTPGEIEAMFGADLATRLRIVNHDGFDENQNATVGTTDALGEVRLAREYVEADKRIALGFIEPHFFAGFSGGPKGIVPAVASVPTIMRLHSFDIIGHPNSSYGVLDGNPTRDAILAAVALRPPEFMVNVTLNPDKEITGFCLGDYIEAHLAGCAHAKAHSMVPVERRFPVVVTSNSGFPLDQNLYQAVKALSVAGRVVEDGGTVFLVSECSDGFPAHGNFGSFMKRGLAPQEMLDEIRRNPFMDQWQAQTLANIALRARVALYSKIARAEVEACRLVHVEDLQAAVDASLARLNGNARAAVLPEGPLTIPYVR